MNKKSESPNIALFVAVIAVCVLVFCVTALLSSRDTAPGTGGCKKEYHYSTPKPATPVPKPTASTGASTYKPSKPKNGGIKTEDPYNVNDFATEEDFYDEHYDDFFDYEDAADYYNEHYEE